MLQDNLKYMVLSDNAFEVLSDIIFYL